VGGVGSQPSLLRSASADRQWSGIAAAPKKHSACYLLIAGSGPMNAGAYAILSAKLGGKDFLRLPSKQTTSGQAFGYFRRLP